MLDTGKLEQKCKEYGIDLGAMEVHKAYRKCFERMRDRVGMRSEVGVGMMEKETIDGGKGTWMGKENASVGGQKV